MEGFKEFLSKYLGAINWSDNCNLNIMYKII